MTEEEAGRAPVNLDHAVEAEVLRTVTDTEAFARAFPPRFHLWFMRDFRALRPAVENAEAEARRLAHGDR